MSRWIGPVLLRLTAILRTLISTGIENMGVTDPTRRIQDHAHAGSGNQQNVPDPNQARFSHVQLPVDRR
jgi:hypothetical protein